VEIDNLKKLIATHEKENEALQNLIFEQNRQHEGEVNEYLVLIKEL
jgi:hypothetical protein